MTVRMGAEDEGAWRFWRNPEPDGPYEPRVTFWPAAEFDDDLGVSSGWLKCEFSIPRMYAQSLYEERGNVGDEIYLVNPTQAQTEQALDAVDRYLAAHFGALPSVASWSCQRVDYAWNYEVGDLLAVYLSVFEHLRLSSYSRHPFDAAEGVVFKGKGKRSRWVKFYNKVRQLRALLGVSVSDTESVLRFEVSNYKDSTRYMADSWFGCERVVGEMLQPGRALYTMARMWDMLNLADVDGYGREEYELHRIAQMYNTRVRGTAYYVLCSWRALGLDAWRLGHVTKSTYYRHIKKLSTHGFLVSVADGVDNREALPALHIPFAHHIEQIKGRQNLAFFRTPPGPIKPGKFSEKTTAWEELAEALAVTGPRSEYLLRLADDYHDDLDQTAQRYPGLRGKLGRSDRIFTSAAD